MTTKRFNLRNSVPHAPAILQLFLCTYPFVLTIRLKLAKNEVSHEIIRHT